MLPSALLALLTLSQAPAPEAVRLLHQGIEQLEDLNDAGARRTLERARKVAGDQPETLARIYLYLGLAHAAASDRERCLESFRLARVLVPSIELPPAVSPRIVKWWKEAGGSDAAPSPAPPVGAAAPVAGPTLLPSPGSEQPPIALVEPVAPGPRRLRGWVLPLAAGALLAVAGGLLTWQAQERSADLNTGQWSRPEAEQLVLAGRGFQLGAVVCWALAAAGVGTGVWWGWLAPKGH